MVEGPIKVYLIGFWADYEQRFFDAADSPDCTVLPINLKSRATLRRLSGCGGWVFPRRAYRSGLRRLMRSEPDACFLFQDNKHLVPFVVGLDRPFIGGLLCRDPLSAKPFLREHLSDLRRKRVAVWSFDPADCAEFDLEPYCQFITPLPEATSVSPTRGAIFVGRDKGRSEILTQIEQMFSEIGAPIEIDIRRSQRADSHRHRPTTYTEYLRKISGASCLIDVVQPGQRGMTLRPLEAAVYGKKLITNNVQLLDSSLYHPDNVLVLQATTTTQSVQDFLARPVTPLPDSVIDAHITASVVVRLARRALELNHCNRFESVDNSAR